MSEVKKTALEQAVENATKTPNKANTKDTSLAVPDKHMTNLGAPVVESVEINTDKMGLYDEAPGTNTLPPAFDADAERARIRAELVAELAQQATAVPRLSQEEIAQRAKVRVAEALKAGAKEVDLTTEEIDAAKAMYLKKIADDRVAAEKLKAALTPRPKNTLVPVKLKADYWPTVQQVVDNPQVPSEFAILPPPNPDPLGVDVTTEARYKAGAVIDIDVDTALKLVGEHKAERADPMTSRAA